jgi:hypothetical protein
MNGQQRAAAVLAVVLLAGVVLVGVGAWLWFPPAGLIAPGVLLVLIGIIGFFGVDVEGERR